MGMTTKQGDCTFSWDAKICFDRGAKINTACSVSNRKFANSTH